MKPGDLVVLRSGSPIMTVKEDLGDRCICEWCEQTPPPQSTVVMQPQPLAVPQSKFFEREFITATLVLIAPI